MFELWFWKFDITGFEPILKTWKAAIKRADKKKAEPFAGPAPLKYLIYCFVVLGFNLLSKPLLLSFPDLRLGMCTSYEN